MISRKLFFKLTWEEIKAKLAIILGVMVSYFVIMPTGFLFFLENDWDFSGSILQYYMASAWISSFFVLTIWALVSAMSTFAYVHSRKKVDFYHSFPIKREILFGIKYMTGFLAVMVPYTVQLILMYVVALCKNEIQTADINAFFVDLAVKTAGFLLIYTVTILAVMLTGKLITTICGTGVLIGYVITLYYVVVSYFQTYFRTCNEAHFILTNNIYNKLIQFFSPIWSYIMLIAGSVKQLNDDRVILHFQGYEMMMVIIMIVVCLIAAMVLYHFRPSESAGKSMAFKKSEPVIKIAITVLAAISISLIMRLMAADNPDMGMVFGFLLGSIFFSGLMEAIYRSDVRAVLQKKRHLFVSMAVAGIIIAIFRLDLIGYDTWIPDRSDVESVALCIGDNYEATEYYGEDDYISTEDYILSHMQLKEDTAAFTLVENAVASLDKYSEDAYRAETFVLVKYNMKNGTEKYRQYYVDFEEEDNWNTYNALYQEEEFLTSIFPVLGEDKTDGKIMMMYGVSKDTDGSYCELAEAVDLTEQQMKKLYNTYKEELKQYTPEKYKDEQAVAYVNWYDKKIHEMAGGRYGWCNTYPVYESFAATRELMQSYGMKEYSLSADDVEEVIMMNGSSSYTKSYTDKEQIKELLPVFPVYEYCYTPDINSYSERWDMEIVVGIGDKATCLYRWIDLNDSRVPEFLKEDMKKAEEVK